MLRIVKAIDKSASVSVQASYGVDHLARGADIVSNIQWSWIWKMTIQTYEKRFFPSSNIFFDHRLSTLFVLADEHKTPRPSDTCYICLKTLSIFACLDYLILPYHACIRMAFSTASAVLGLNIPHAPGIMVAGVATLETPWRQVSSSLNREDRKLKTGFARIQQAAESTVGHMTWTAVFRRISTVLIRL